MARMGAATGPRVSPQLRSSGTSLGETGAFSHPELRAVLQFMSLSSYPITFHILSNFIEVSENVFGRLAVPWWARGWGGQDLLPPVGGDGSFFPSRSSLGRQPDRTGGRCHRALRVGARPAPQLTARARATPSPPAPGQRPRTRGALCHAHASLYRALRVFHRLLIATEHLPELLVKILVLQNGVFHKDPARLVSVPRPSAGTPLSQPSWTHSLLSGNSNQQ